MIIFKKNQKKSLKSDVFSSQSMVISKITDLINRSSNIFRLMKLQRRFVILFLVISLIPLVFLGTVSYLKSSKAIKEKIQLYSIQLMDQASLNIQSKIEQMNNRIMSFSSGPVVQNYIDNYQSASSYDIIQMREAVKNQMVSSISTKEGVDKFVTLSFEDDSKMVGSQWNRMWKVEEYKKLLDETLAATFDLKWELNEKSKLKTDSQDFLIRKPILTAGSFKSKAVLFLVLSNEYISNIFKGMNIGSGADVFVLDSQGKVISSVNKDIVIGNLYENKSIVDKIKSLSKDNVTQRTSTEEISGKSYMLTYAKVKDTDWYILATVPFSYLNKETESIKFQVILVCIISLIIAAILSSMITSSISSPLRKLIQSMNKLKNGDLTVQVKDQWKDEITEVNSNFNDTVSNVRVLIEKVQRVAGSVTDNSSKINTSVESFFVSAKQVSVAVQQIAEGANQQAIDSNQGLDQVKSMSAGVNVVANNMESASEVISTTKEICENALATVNELNDSAVRTSTTFSTVAKDIHILNDKTREIEGILKVIQGISKQTNLLALNSSIEAAKAGAAGRGFVVIAESVRKLAEKSNDATGVIGEILKSIKNQTLQTVSTVNDSQDVIEKQMRIVGQTDNAFKTIVNSMDDIDERIKLTNESVAEIIRINDNAMAVMENVSSIAEETAAGTEQVSASSEEQMAASEELYEMSNKLRNMAEELHSAVSTFKI